jgi:glycosyltransferase involved in cell wall biosynthesis
MTVELSVVIPIYNEQESIPILYQEIARVFDAMGLDRSEAEIIWIDDCSTDGSLRRILALREHDPRVRAVKLRRNFGQTAALAAGFEEARGGVVVTLDGDLQNDPADIPALVAELERGFDIVAGWRKRRHDGLLLRRLPSMTANRLISWFTGVSIHDTGCTLKAFRLELLKSMSIYAEQHRFLPALCAGSGARVSELVVNHRPRRFGRSKYGIGRATRVLLDLLSVKMISQFSHRPVQYFGMIALAALAFCMLFGVAGLLGVWGTRSNAREVPGIDLAEPVYAMNNWEMAIWTILLMVFTLFVFFALLGLLGELAVKASGMHRRSTLDRFLNELH